MIIPLSEELKNPGPLKPHIALASLWLLPEFARRVRPTKGQDPSTLLEQSPHQIIPKTKTIFL